MTRDAFTETAQLTDLPGNYRVSMTPDEMNRYTEYMRDQKEFRDWEKNRDKLNAVDARMRGGQDVSDHLLESLATERGKLQMALYRLSKQWCKDNLDLPEQQVLIDPSKIMEIEILVTYYPPYSEAYSAYATAELIKPQGTIISPRRSSTTEAALGNLMQSLHDHEFFLNQPVRFKIRQVDAPREGSRLV